MYEISKGFAWLKCPSGHC